MCETIDLPLGSLVDGEDQSGRLRCAFFGDNYFERLIDKHLLKTKGSRMPATGGESCILVLLVMPLVVAALRCAAAVTIVGPGFLIRVLPS